MYYIVTKEHEPKMFKWFTERNILHKYATDDHTAIYVTGTHIYLFNSRGCENKLEVTSE